MQESIISGLISGVTVTLLVIVVRNFWTAVIVPWFEERVYKDTKIEGKWFGLYPTSTDLRQDVIVLKRHGHAITGTMTCTKGGDEGDEYSLCGSFRNMLLPLTYETTDKAKTDRGSISLVCVRNGQRLKGNIAFYSTAHDDIYSGNILWFRNKEDLDKTIAKIKLKEDRLAKIKEEKARLAAEEAEIEDTNGEVIEGEVVDSEKGEKDEKPTEIEITGGKAANKPIKQD